MTARTEDRNTARERSSDPSDPAADGGRRAASTRTVHRRRTPLAWLPWALLGLIAALLLLTVLVVRSVGSDSATSGTGAVGASSDASSDAGAGSDRAPSGSEGTSADAGTDAGTDASLVAADGQDVLALASSGLDEAVGQQVSGTATVQSVVADEGFWVGADESDRVFVFLTPEARGSNEESGFTVEQGQTVSVEGAVSRSDESFADSTGVASDEGRQQLLDQGGYVQATEIALVP